MEYPVGSQPNAIVASDFNDDGHLDLAVADPGLSSVLVLLGKGDGTFQSPTDYAIGAGPFSIAVGDFNGDGVDDLVTANSGGALLSNSVSVLLGKRDGTFAQRVDYPTDDGPVSVAVGDFNGDGFDDLAVAALQGKTMQRSPREGRWHIPSSSGLPAPDVSDNGVAAASQAVAVGDFNGDGALDVAVSDPLLDEISVFMGEGDGTFSARIRPGSSQRTPSPGGCGLHVERT